MATMMKVMEQKQSVSFYGRGADEIDQIIFCRIETSDKYKVWYIQDFIDLGKYQVIRLALERLTKKKCIQKIKAWPVFYKKLEVPQENKG